MEEKTARHYLRVGLAGLDKQRPQWERRENYLLGIQDAPYAPEGVNAEYQALQDQSIANWLALAMKAPVQRMRPEGIRRGGEDGQVDLDTWNSVWQPNKLDARAPIVFLSMMAHGRGIWSASKNPRNPTKPIIRVENGKRVWLEPDPENPFENMFAVKTVEMDDPDSAAGSSLWLPDSVSRGKIQLAYVYDHEEWVRFRKRGNGFTGGKWELVDQGKHGLGELPFVASDINVDADGVPHSALEPLMPQQDALNTIRFNTLLAMQFSAYRQRVFTGYDPVAKDSQGNVLFEKQPDGKLVIDNSGRPIPILNSPGRIGVDRALVFPGKDTEVFDMPESSLDNYVKVYQDFMTTFFAIAQTPPQYSLNRMANLSGDALEGADTTTKYLVKDLQSSAGEALETVCRLGNRARGAAGGDDYSSVIMWGDDAVRPFSQTIDAIVKLISTGFPRRAAFEMIPGATPPKVEGWMTQIKIERADENDVIDRAMRTLVPAARKELTSGAAPMDAEVVPDAASIDS